MSDSDERDSLTPLVDGPQTGVGEMLPAVLRSTGPDLLAVAEMPQDEFEARLAMVRRGQQRIQQMKQSIMAEGVHYGTIPGTRNPTLYKAGAEVLLSAFGLRPDFEIKMREGNGRTHPMIAVLAKCLLHEGSLDGPVIAVGYGEANSHEKRHRWRRGEKICPECHKSGTVIKGKTEYGGGWLCWAKRDGCGAKWPDGDPAIEGQDTTDVENSDPYDLANTLVKMAKKRAMVDATLTGTASSDLFTQDMEDSAGANPGAGVTVVPAQPAVAQAATKPARAPSKWAPFWATARALGMERDEAYAAISEAGHDLGEKPSMLQFKGTPEDAASILLQADSQDALATDTPT